MLLTRLLHASIISQVSSDTLLMKISLPLSNVRSYFGQPDTPYPNAATTHIVGLCTGLLKGAAVELLWVPDRVSPCGCADSTCGVPHRYGGYRCASPH
jgi:hypothetical protein